MNATVVQLPTVESLSDEIRGLVYERQTLRTVGAGAEGSSATASSSSEPSRSSSTP